MYGRNRYGSTRYGASIGISIVTLSSAISAAATVITSIKITKEILAAITADVELTANLVKSFFLVSIIEASASLSADIAISRLLTTAITANADLTAILRNTPTFIATLTAESTLTSSFFLTAKLGAVLTSDASFSATILGTWAFVSSIEAAADLTASLRNLVPFSITIEAAATLNCQLIERIIAEMVYSGNLAPGTTVIIDGINNTITIAGANVRKDFNGVFPLLLPGENKIIYEDSEGSRTITIRIEKEDRST